MAQTTQAAATTKKEAPKPRAEWPKKFKNWTQGPLTLDLKTQGTVSLGGKKPIWIWAADFAEPSVQQAIRNKTLIAWNDKEPQPTVEPTPPKPIIRQKGMTDVKPGLIKGPNQHMVPASQTLAQVLTEGDKSGPLPSREPKVMTRESMAQSRDPKPTAARGQVAVKPRRG
jgi:hypothetical protein